MLTVVGTAITVQCTAVAVRVRAVRVPNLFGIRYFLT